MLDSRSPKGLRIVQITTDPDVESHHLYPECPMFTPDSRKFVFLRSEGKKHLRGYWLCDLGDNFALRKLVGETGVVGLVVSPDGRWAYYILDRMSYPEQAFVVKRVSLEDFRGEVLFTYDGAIPGKSHKLSRLRGPTSISSDGKRLCGWAFLGDGKSVNGPFGILVFDIEARSTRLIFQAEEFCNMHLQYCHSTDAQHSHDILVQHNHGAEVDPSGTRTRLQASEGADLHVVRDDTTHWRDVPIGRDGVLFHTGHEQWRGRMPTVISSMSDKSAGRHRLFESWPIATDAETSHRGSRIPGARNTDLTRLVPDTNFDHFSMDPSGMYLVARQGVWRECGHIELYLASFSTGPSPVLSVRYLLTPGTVKQDRNKPRPFFSPDARMVFFHSDLDGPSQIFVAMGYELPARCATDPSSSNRQTTAAGVCVFRHNEITDAEIATSIGKFEAFREFFDERANAK